MQGNNGVEVIMPGRTNSPAKVSGNNISVNFSGDPGCCTGVFRGNKIYWSNGTVWPKN
mgnify:FL=1